MSDRVFDLITKSIIAICVAFVFAVIIYASFARAEDNVMQIDNQPSYAQHDLVSIALGYEGMTARQIGLPARLWCADFLNYVRRKAGLRVVPSRRAIDQARYGRRINHPVRGALVITWRDNGAHVDLIKRRNPDGSLETIGGNIDGEVASRTRYVSNAIYVMPD